jgi:hypothetical protein
LCAVVHALRDDMGDGAAVRFFSRRIVDCLRVQDRYIYAAQFHIEMAGTPETSRRIMANFLKIAKTFGGYNPAAQSVSPPRKFRDN